MKTSQKGINLILSFGFSSNLIWIQQKFPPHRIRKYLLSRWQKSDHERSGHYKRKGAELFATVLPTMKK
jgi:hypothetical protein